MLVSRLNIRRLSKINLNPLPHDSLAVQNLPDANRAVVVEERDDDAAEGAQGCPRVDRSAGVDEVFDCLKIVCAEDLGVLEVGY